MLATARRKAVLFALLCVLLLVVFTAQLRTPDGRAAGVLGAWGLAALGPVQSVLDAAADRVAQAWRALLEIGSLRQENARLRDDLARLRRENARLREAAAAAPRLEALLGLRAAAGERVRAARVVARATEEWFASVVIDRGARDGIARNDAVLTPEGLVGRVIEVAGGYARVLLVTDPRSGVAVRLQSTREVGVVEGRGERAMALRYVARDARLTPGERVITSGYGGVFPPGLVVGYLVQVRSAPGGLFQEATVIPAADLSRLDEVLVLVGRQ